MASVLRRSWILDFFTGRRKPSSSPSVQVVRVVRRAPWTEVVLSDKFHTMRAILAPDALARFLGDNGNLTLAKLVGTIVLLHEYALSSLEGILVLRVDRFALLCGEPMAPVGEPVDVMSIGEVKHAAIAWQPSQDSSSTSTAAPPPGPTPLTDELPIVAGGQPPPPPAHEAARLMDMADTEDVSAILAVADACTQDPAADAAAALDEDGFRAPPPPSTPAAATPDAGSSCPDSGVSYASTSSSVTIVGHPRPLMVSTTRAVRATRDHIAVVFDPRAEPVRAADCIVPPEQHNRLAKLPGWPAEPLVPSADADLPAASQSQPSPRRRLSSTLSQSSDVLQLSQQSSSQIPPTPTPTVPLQQPRPTFSSDEADEDEEAGTRAVSASVPSSDAPAPADVPSSDAPAPADVPAVAATPATPATPAVDRRTPSTEEAAALHVEETPERTRAVAETPPERAVGRGGDAARERDAIVSQALSSSSDESDGVQCLLKTPPKRTVTCETATLLLEDVSSASPASSPSQTRMTESQTQPAPSAELFTMPETMPQQRLRFSTAQPLSYEPPSFSDEATSSAEMDDGASSRATQSSSGKRKRGDDDDEEEEEDDDESDRSSVRSLLLASDYRGVGLTEMELEDAEHAARTGAAAPPPRRKRRRAERTDSIAFAYGASKPAIWLATEVDERAAAAVRDVLADAKPADGPLSFSWLVSLARRFSAAGLIGSL